MGEIIIEKSYKAALNLGQQHDQFRKKFLRHIKQLSMTKEDLHPKFKETALSIHNLVTKETTPYEIKYTKDNLTKQLQITLITASLRSFGDSDDVVRNPEKNITEHIVAIHDDNVPYITCPNCGTKRKGRTTITTETYAILWCADCEKYIWKEHFHKLYF